MQLMLTGYLTSASQKQKRGVGVVPAVAVTELNEFFLLKAGKIRSRSTKCVSGAFV